MFSCFQTNEVDWEEGARQIDDCSYLFAESIGEISELTLGLVILEAKAQDRVYSPANDSPLETDAIGEAQGITLGKSVLSYCSIGGRCS